MGGRTMKACFKWAVGFFLFLKEFFLPAGFSFKSSKSETEIQSAVKCLEELRDEQFREEPAMQEVINEIKEELSDPLKLPLVNRERIREKFLSLWDAAAARSRFYFKPAWQVANGHLSNLNLL